MHEYLVAPLRAPVAMSLWNTSQNALGRHANRLERALPADVLGQLPPMERFTDLFKLRYPKSFEMAFGTIRVEPQRIEETLVRSGVSEYFVETEAEDVYNSILLPNDLLGVYGLLKMFAKFDRLEQIIAEMEATRGETFSHVCWIRPDAKLNRFSRRELTRWLLDFENGWGEASRHNMVLDYIMVLPRRIFATLARIFPAIIHTGSTQFAGWRPITPQLIVRTGAPWPVGGPDTIASTLFANGITLQRIMCVKVELVGYMPPVDELRACFQEEHRGR